MINGTLERAILETLAYSDIFDYPLRLEEIHRYASRPAALADVAAALCASNQVGQKDDFYFLRGRERIAETRNQREACSRQLWPFALRYGHMLGRLPFIRMVALTGSLAMMNSSGDADLDYLLVAASGRVWTARAFALLLNRFTRPLGHTLCPNIIVSENALTWFRRDLYTAHELCQMIPIAGMDVYQKLMKENEWVNEFLPNAFLASNTELLDDRQKPAFAIQNILELPLRGRLGDRFESWEMNRKVARFSKQPGFGEETIFNAEMCQGNFDQHSKKTRLMFEEKLSDMIEAEGIRVGEL